MAEQHQSVEIPRVKLGTQGLEVSKLGFGCVGLTGFYNDPVPEHHRVDTNTPIEDTMSELKKLVEEGKIKYIGLSEASPETIKRAHGSSDNCFADGVVAMVSQTMVKYYLNAFIYAGNLGSGLFHITLSVAVSLVAKEWWKHCLQLVIWFQVENLEKNKIIYLKIEKMAEKHGCTPAQLALAWVLHQGDDVALIPGTTKFKNLDSNIGSLKVKLSEEDLKEISDAVPTNEVAGDRLPEGFKSIHLEVW
ncbi:Perakine reductase [Hibiscus syriacus]|uniref:Perakine reductase n=1 Tax=Hibiscus syriacus TaxID=106335 RepID=A0A6A3CPG0_HIBSY|nr:Perakine reductase [Hibiscus syriacus]